MKRYSSKTLAILLVGGGLILTGALDAPYGGTGGPAWAAESSPPASPAPPKQSAPPVPSAPAAPAASAPAPREAAPEIRYEKSMEPEIPAKKLPKAGVTEIRRGPEASD